MDITLGHDADLIRLDDFVLIFNVTANLNRSVFKPNRTYVQDTWWCSLKTILFVLYVITVFKMEYKMW